MEIMQYRIIFFHHLILGTLLFYILLIIFLFLVWRKKNPYPDSIIAGILLWFLKSLRSFRKILLHFSSNWTMVWVEHQFDSKFSFYSILYFDFKNNNKNEIYMNECATCIQIFSFKYKKSTISCREKKPSRN